MSTTSPLVGRVVRRFSRSKNGPTYTATPCIPNSPCPEQLGAFFGSQGTLLWDHLDDGGFIPESSNLDDFIDIVEMKRGNQITETQADELVALAKNVIASLEAA